MADTTITELSLASGIDAITDWLPIDRTSLGVTQRINRNTYLGITGSPVGTSDSQSIGNKTIGVSNTVTLLDTLFTIADNSDPTKLAQFQLSGITTSTTRTYTLPNASSTLADISTTQTFTNKTLTSPVITGGSIDNSTITVDSIAGHTTPTSGTIYGMSISSGKVGTNGVITGSITDSSVTSSKVAAGFVVQVATTTSGAVATGTTLIPEDDTIPQITEGTEFMTLAITPKSATNRLYIRIQAAVSTSNTNSAVGALFQDATANALAAKETYIAAGNATGILLIEYDMVAGTVASTTFRFRSGPAVTATLTFNGFGGARKFGGITLSSIEIIEYKA